MKQIGVVCLPGPASLFLIFQFEYLISGPKSYRDFRETGLRTENLTFLALFLHQGVERRTFARRVGIQIPIGQFTVFSNVNGNVCFRFKLG